MLEILLGVAVFLLIVNVLSSFIMLDRIKEVKTLILSLFTKLDGIHADVNRRSPTYTLTQPPLSSTAIYNETLRALREYKQSFEIVKDPLGEREPETKSVDKFVFENLFDAQEVLRRLKELVDKYGIAVLHDVLDLTGIEPTFEDSRWGWNDLSEAKIVKYEDEHCEMILPDMRLLADLENTNITNGAQRFVYEQPKPKLLFDKG